MKYEKKYLNLIFSVLFSLIVLSGAYSLNTQKQYEISSKEWKTVNLICMLSGTVGPSSVGPVSGEELLIALDRIDRSCLINGWEKEYDRIRKEIEDPYAMISFDGFRFDTAPAFGLEMYGQTSNDIWISEDDWRLTFKNRIPLAAIPLEMDFCGTFYGITDFSLMPSFMNSRDEHKASAYFTHYFSTNIGAILSPEIGLMKAMPHKAGISGGNHYAHFAAGRFRQSIGNGHTGNLMLGDNFLYQELLKMSFHNRNFTYNWSCTHFDQQPQTGMTAPDALTGSTYLENLSFNGKHNVRIVHSYGITPLDNFNISLHFGNMIQSDSPLDLRWLNPFMFMHNWFNYAWYNKNEKIESNNHFALTFEYVPLRGWAITGQLMVDQFQLPGEQQAANPPNALGFLLNTAYSVPLKTGAVTCYMEAVYTTPALYLNEKYVDEEGNLSHENSPGAVAYDWNQDLIVGYSLWYGSELSYTGYKHGPDCMLFSIGTNYMIPEKLDLTGFCIFRMHGVHGIAWEGNRDPRITPTDDAWDIWLAGPIEYLLQFTADASWTITDWLGIRCTLSHMEKWNNRNIPGERWRDTQITLGACVQYSPSR